MSPLHSLIALGPVAVYLLLLGMLNLSRKPLLTSGARDLLVLGVALTGMFVVGPLDLFMPQAAAVRFGPYVWILILSVYWMSLSLITLLVRPRLVIYNLKVEQIRPLLAQVMQRLELEHHWAGESLALPTLGIQLQLETFPIFRNVSLVANGSRQALLGWHRFQRELARELQQIKTTPNLGGVLLVAFSLLVLAILEYRIWRNPSAAASHLLELLRM